MKYILNILMLVTPVLFGSGCFVEKDAETDLVLSFNLQETYSFDITGGFNESRIIAKEEFTDNLDIPEGARVKKVDVEYVAARIVELPGNTATEGIKMQAFVNGSPFFAREEALGFSQDLTVIHDLNETTVVALREQLFTYVDDNITNDEDLIIGIQGIPNPTDKTLRATITVRLQGAVTIASAFF